MNEGDKLIRVVQLVLFALVVLSILALVVPRYALAGGKCNGHSCNDVNVDAELNSDVEVNSNVSVNPVTSVDAASSTAVDVTSRDRSYGLSLGDVDINDCYRSYQVLAVWQGSQKNRWCMADSLDAKGMHEAAAKVRCSLDGYRKLFGSHDECLALSTMPPMPTEPVVAAEPTVSEDDDDFQREQEEELAMLRADLEAKIQNLEHAQRTSPRVERRIIEQQPYLSDEQRSALRELKQ